MAAPMDVEAKYDMDFKVLSKITPVLTEKFIELVRKNEALYDASSPHHKDAVMLSNIWQGIAGQINVQGLTGEDLKKKWRTLRDTYVRKRKEIANAKRSGGAALKVLKWKYMDILGFLDKFIKENNTESNMSEDLSQEEEVYSDGNSDTGNYDSQNSVMSEICPSPGSDTPISRPQSPLRQITSTPIVKTMKKKPTLKRKGERKSDDQFETTFLELAKAHTRRIQTETQPGPKDAIDCFFESCALRAKKLTVEKQGWMQMQVSTILYQLESQTNPIASSEQGYVQLTNVQPQQSGDVLSMAMQAIQ